MRKKLFISLLTIAVVFLATAACAQQQREKGFLIKLWEKISARFTRAEEAPLEPVAPAMPVKKEEAAVKTPPAKPKVILSKEKIIEVIQKRIKVYPEILGRIEGLSRGKSMDGRVNYYYRTPGGIDMKLQALDKNTLYDILLRVEKESAEARKRKKPLPAAEAPPVKEIAPPKEPEDAPAEKIAPGKSGEEEAVPEEAPEEEKPEPEEMPISKEEMIEVIKRRVQVYSQIPYLIPNFYSEVGADGERVYYYSLPGQVAMRLEELDKKTIQGLFVRVNNEATRLRTEQLMRQIQQQEQIMRTIQQQQQLQRQQQPVTPPGPPPEPPKIYVPPQPPPQPPAPPVPPPSERR